MMKSNGSIICQSTTITASLQVYGSHLAAGIEIWVHVGKISHYWVHVRKIPHYWVHVGKIPHYWVHVGTGSMLEKIHTTGSMLGKNHHILLMVDVGEIHTTGSILENFNTWYMLEQLPNT